MNFKPDRLRAPAIVLSEPRIHVVHSTAPGCSWSWGYEPVINRLRMVYGDQIDVHLRLGCPYESWEQWQKDYSMSEKEALDWMNDECFPMMGLPFARLTPEKVPQNVLPATLATVAALRQGMEKGWRFNRALLRMIHVEQRDLMDPKTPLAAAQEASLDVPRFQKDAEDEKLIDEYGELAQSGPPVHVGFYNVVVWDGGNRKVMLDYTFEPTVIEEAIDYMAGGTLRKTTPRDVHAYIARHGYAPLVEIQRVFDLAPKDALTELERLEKAGKADRKTLAGAPHWRGLSFS